MGRSPIPRVDNVMTDTAAATPMPTKNRRRADRAAGHLKFQQIEFVIERVGDADSPRAAISRRTMDNDCAAGVDEVRRKIMQNIADRIGGPAFTHPTKIQTTTSRQGN